MPTTSASPPAPLRHWIAGCLLAMLVFGLCWTVALGYWRTHGADPGVGALALFLLVLPGGVLGAAFVARKILTADAAAATPAPAAPTAPAKPPPLSPLPLAILATAVRSPHGASVEELEKALEGKKARPTLDASLVDDDGFPLTTARCDQADDAPLQANIAAWLAASNSPAFDGEHLRALVLATFVTRELAGQAVGALVHDSQPAPMLQLAPVLPGDWNAAQHHTAGLWLQHLVAEAGWPLTRIALVPVLDVDTIPSRLLAQLATRAPDAQVTALLVACASTVGNASVQAWSANNTLFTSSADHGKVPGEGAVAMLLTDVVQAPTAPLLAPLATARRPGSADTARGAVPPLLADLARGALAAAQIDEDALAAIVADTGPRPGRMLELMTVAAIAPQLDNDKDIIAFGHASGHCGAVPGLTALVMASHLACSLNAPVLWLSNEDPFQRCVAVVQP